MENKKIYYLPGWKSIGTGLVLGLMICSVFAYTTTFFEWKKPETPLFRINATLEFLSWFPTAILLLFGLIASTSGVGPWRTDDSVPWKARLFAICFVLTCALLIGTFLLSRPVALRLNGSTAQIEVNGQWETQSRQMVESLVRHNARRYISYLMFSLVLVLGMLMGRPVKRK